MLSTMMLVCYYTIAFAILVIAFCVDRRVTKRRRAARQHLVDRLARLLIEEAESITRSAIAGDEADDDE